VVDNAVQDELRRIAGADRRFLRREQRHRRKEQPLVAADVVAQTSARGHHANVVHKPGVITGELRLTVQRQGASQNASDIGNPLRVAAGPPFGEVQREAYRYE
jgi:hypothetical protein